MKLPMTPPSSAPPSTPAAIPAPPAPAAAPIRPPTAAPPRPPMAVLGSSWIEAQPVRVKATSDQEARSTKWSMDTATSLVRRLSLGLDGGAELGETGSGQVGPVRCREVLEQALVGRDGRLLLAGELLVPCEPQEEVLVEE